MNTYNIEMKSNTKHGKLWGTVVRGVSKAYAEKRVEQLKREGFEARVVNGELVA